MKRAMILYRESIKKMYDNRKEDIPMQRAACREFAEKHNWVIVKEFCEKGVSGFKVSANDRDAILELKEAALRKEFDVLLVFMFDRLGRIDSETPFILEWFVGQGIEMWSTQEGQQRIENQTDKLINYMRFWQANGESVKTSIRVSATMKQLTAEGIYHGGVTPFGYRTVDNGRINARGKSVRDIEINPQEAYYVKMIFDKTVNEGYGSYRMAEYLNQLGVKTHNGSDCQCNTVNRILRNRFYCGYYTSGETISPKQEYLVIVDENIFDMAQKILGQRSTKNTEKQSIARTTKGRSLLSGNVICGHCGAHMIATGYVDKRTRSDGSIYMKNGVRYTCYHRTRRLNDCDGQSVYSATKIDEEVSAIVEEYLERIKSTPREKALEIRYQREIDLRKQRSKELILEKEKLTKRLQELSNEVGKSLTGESRFSVEILSASIDTTKAEIDKIKTLLFDCEKVLEEKKSVLGKLDFYYNQFISWADEFKKSSLERKKMIICNLIEEIKLSKGYQIDVKFNLCYEQFFATETIQG